MIVLMCFYLFSTCIWTDVCKMPNFVVVKASSLWSLVESVLIVIVIILMRLIMMIIIDEVISLLVDYFRVLYCDCLDYFYYLYYLICLDLVLIRLVASSFLLHLTFDLKSVYSNSLLNSLSPILLRNRLLTS